MVKKLLLGSMALSSCLLLGAAVQPASAAKAADLFADIDISGFMDTYYSHNFNKPRARSAFGSSGIETNRFRAFDQADDSLVVDNFELQIEKAVSDKNRSGFKLITNYGALANRITFNSNTTRGYGRVDDDDFTFSVAYVNYLIDAGNGIDVKVGKMATWIGAEPWESVDNLNYSRSLLYQNGDPFTHTGVSASYQVNDMFSATGYIVNGWDTFEDNNRAKSLGYSLAMTTDTFTLVFNGIHGDEMDEGSTVQGIRNVFDVVLDIKPVDNLQINLNFINATEEKIGSWRGASGIVAYDFTDWFKLAARGEVFIDRTYSMTMPTPRLGITGQRTVELYEATLTATFKIDNNILVRPEYRHDWSQKKLFDSDTIGGRSSKRTQDTFLVSVAYIF